MSFAVLWPSGIIRPANEIVTQGKRHQGVLAIALNGWTIGEPLFVSNISLIAPKLGRV